jgi:hypothetical protein
VNVERRSHMQGSKSKAKSSVARTVTALSKAPVFSLGCSRSGTTLFYHMLLSSGDFAVYRSESHVLTLLEPRFKPLSSQKNKRKLLDAWYQSRLFTKTGLSKEQIEPRIMVECENGGDFLRIFMEEMCRQQGVERWAETTPEHLLYLRRIKETIPNALIVHVIRDGRDVALSWEKLSQIRRLPGDRKRAAMAAAIYWEWFVTRGRKVGRTLGADYMEVYYEDLVRKPAEVLKKVAPFIEHELDYEKITQVATGSVTAPNTAYKGEERSPIGRWRTDFTAEELETCEALIGGTLRELGYEPATEAGRKPTPAGLATMRAAYRRFFEAKLFMKTKTPAGRRFVTQNLARL